MTICEPEASEERMSTVTRLLASYDYTRAELLLAMREVPRDPEASHNYGRGFNLADVERVIRKSRELRARLRQRLTAKMRDELCAEFPELDPKDFRSCGFDGHNNTLYRYAPEVRDHTDRPQPKLEDKAPPRREGKGKTRDLSGAVKGALEGLEAKQASTEK